MMASRYHAAGSGQTLVGVKDVGSREASQGRARDRRCDAVTSEHWPISFDQPCDRSICAGAGEERSHEEWVAASKPHRCGGCEAVVQIFETIDEGPVIQLLNIESARCGHWCSSRTPTRAKANDLSLWRMGLRALRCHTPCVP